MFCPALIFLEREEGIEMTDNFIQLNKDDILRLKIRTFDGEDTGKYLEFDLGDIELPLKYQDLLEKDKKNKIWVRNQLLIISKREDIKGKKLLSKNQEDEIKALNEFYKKEIEVYNMFLGKNGVEKLLNGRKISWTTFDEINKIIEKQIVPHLNNNMKTITDKIKDKYTMPTQKNKEVMKADE